MNDDQTIIVPSTIIQFPASTIMYMLLLVVGNGLIFVTVQQNRLNTVVLFSIISLSGLFLCRKTQSSLKDPKLKILESFWLLKLVLTLFLLYAGWIPQLEATTSDLWGYDPQRYYFQAQELLENGWSPDFLSLNYVGILYYYAAMYYLIGHNPVIPALINSFVTLLASLYLVKVGYSLNSQRGPLDWTLGIVLLLPEVLWYDVMTSRETLLAALLLFAMLTTGCFIAKKNNITIYKCLLIVGLTATVIAAVRTSMLMPLFASIVLMVLIVKTKDDSRLKEKTALVGVAIVAFMAGPIITGYLGGYDYGVGKSIQSAALADSSMLFGPDIEWSEHSIGMLLIPNNSLYAIIFLPLRMLLYLVSPLPSFYVPINDLLSGSWQAWQKLLILLSSIVNILAIPYALSSLIQSIKTRKTNSDALVFHISYWITFIAIAGGNLIIHERYRIMATLLLWGCAWLGARTCSRRLIWHTSLLWYGILSFGALFYIGFKSVFI